MIAQRSVRSARLEWIDFALAALMGILAVYSVGVALSRTTLGTMFMAGIFLGTLFSFAMSRVTMRSSLANYAGYLYAAVVALSFVAFRNLNGYLPDEGFPMERELVATGFLCWFLLLGSFSAWSDSTLLFQAVPCITIFALVGAVDTFKGATFVFFFYLIGAATLYARAHHRAMLVRAEESGYADIKAIRSGPWRWIAGPEWAVGSAFVIVIASVLGAPVIQKSVQGVAGVVAIMPPIAPQAFRSPIGAPSSSLSFRIGQGPRMLSERTLFRIRIDEPRYLRMSTYVTYTGTSWTRPNATDPDTQAMWLALRRERRRLILSNAFRDLDFVIALDSGFADSVPVPGEVLRLSPDYGWRLLSDGTAVAGSGIPLFARVGGTARVQSDTVRPVNSPLPIPDYMWPFASCSAIPDSVVKLADDACAGLTTDYDKALAIKSEIERRAKYNLQAEAAAPEVDPVVNFLFGSREGYCDLFASSMALMARSQGIPARVVTGYYPFYENRTEDGWFEVRESDAHAWAELYFDGVGWVPFDPTEGAVAVPGGERGTPTLRTPLFETAWFQRTIGAIIIALGLAGAFFIFASYRGWRAKLSEETYALAKAYEQFVAILQKSSDRPRRAWETPKEYLSAVSAKLGPASESAAKITEGFEIAFYANGHVDKPKASELEAAIQELKSVLKLRPAQSRSEA